MVDEGDLMKGEEGGWRGGWRGGGKVGVRERGREECRGRVKRSEKGRK